MESITSRSNPLIAHIRRLIADRGYRRNQGELVCEGPKLLEEASAFSGAITTILVTETTAPLPPLPEDVRVVCVPEGLLSWVADTKTPQGLLFTCRIPVLLSESCRGERFLVLDGVQDPGNVGTIWRTADAFGADGLFLLPGCADPWSPKTVRATMGACFRLPVWEVGLEALLGRLKEGGLSLCAAALRADARDVREADLKGAAVVIGSEGRGVSGEVLALCDMALRIPMRPRCESLNAAAAASVILWEMARHTNLG